MSSFSLTSLPIEVFFLIAEYSAPNPFEYADRGLGWELMVTCKAIKNLVHDPVLRARMMKRFCGGNIQKACAAFPIMRRNGFVQNDFMFISALLIDVHLPRFTYQRLLRDIEFTDEPLAALISAQMRAQYAGAIEFPAEWGTDDLDVALNLIEGKSPEDCDVEATLEVLREEFGVEVGVLDSGFTGLIDRFVELAISELLSEHTNWETLGRLSDFGLIFKSDGSATLEETDIEGILRWMWNRDVEYAHFGEAFENNLFFRVLDNCLNTKKSIDANDAWMIQEIYEMFVPEDDQYEEEMRVWCTVILLLVRPFFRHIALPHAPAAEDNLVLAILLGEFDDALRLAQTYEIESATALELLLVDEECRYFILENMDDLLSVDHLPYDLPGFINYVYGYTRRSDLRDAINRHLSSYSPLSRSRYRACEFNPYKPLICYCALDLALIDFDSMLPGFGHEVIAWMDESSNDCLLRLETSVALNDGFLGKSEEELQALANREARNHLVEIMGEMGRLQIGEGFSFKATAFSRMDERWIERVSINFGITVNLGPGQFWIPDDVHEVRKPERIVPRYIRHVF